jgi:hypothetical protein
VGGGGLIHTARLPLRQPRLFIFWKILARAAGAHGFSISGTALTLRRSGTM